MNNITLAQREALDVVVDMIDKSNTTVPDYGTKIMTLILGILNVDCRVEHTVTQITQIDDDKTTPITPDNGNDKLQQGIEMPDWIKTQPFPPFIPGDKSQDPAPWQPRVWYNHEPERTKIVADTNAQEDRRYATTVTGGETGDKNCITTTRNPNDCITYTGNTGDFRDEREQSTFKDK
jgi:hypothetical protein